MPEYFSFTPTTAEGTKIDNREVTEFSGSAPGSAEKTFEFYVPVNPSNYVFVTNDNGGVSGIASLTLYNEGKQGDIFNFYGARETSVQIVEVNDDTSQDYEVTYSYQSEATTYPYLCFMQGTRIRTARGDVAVEDLAVGEAVVTRTGAQRPIRWLGHRAVDCRRDPIASQPVRISAHALGEGIPARPLFLSPGHPVLVGADEDGNGGHLVPIMCLINGTTVERASVEAVTYWHVELDAHDILLAESLPAESYIDLGSRHWFDGTDGALYDPDLALPDMPGRCRPVAVDGPIVDAERKRLDMLFVSQLDAACAWPRTGDSLLPLS